MNLLDKEVFAIITAAVIVASVMAASEIVKPYQGSQYAALGLLNQNCVIGDYPSVVNNGDNVTLCIYVSNHLGYPALFLITYKIGNASTLPTNTSPSLANPILQWDIFLENGENTTFTIEVPVDIGPMNTPSKEVALIFELWYLSPESGDWVYSGEWVNLYIRVNRPALGGG